MPVTFSILDRNERENEYIYLFEITTGNIHSGKYSLYLIAEERNSRLRTSTKTIFEVK